MAGEKMNYELRYRREIDGLRALAVLPVILFHAGIKGFSGGFVGVDVFFVISGYLITYILMVDLEHKNYSIVKFYERRIRRILPALVVVLFASFLISWFILLPADMEEFSLSLVATVTFWSNIFFWLQSGYFATAAELKPLLHTWSLSVEEQYYIFFPLLLAVLWPFGQKIVATTLAAIFVASFALCIWDFGYLSEPEASFFLLPTRAWELMVGSLTAIFVANFGDKILGWVGSSLMSFFGIGLILYSVLFFSENTPFPSAYALVPTLGKALILIFEREGSLSFRLLSNPAFVFIGLISYSAYLWHQPLFAFYRYYVDGELSQSSRWILIALTLLLAWLSYRFVERPFRQKGKISRRHIFGFWSAATLLIISIGAFGKLTDGFIGRYPEKLQPVFLQFENPGKYVRSRFNALVDAPFSDEDLRTKLLIIGDSYGQDVVNGIYEAGLDQVFQISTFHISKRCGNIFTSQDITVFQAEGDRKFCEGRKTYSDRNLQNKIKTADMIWLISSWQSWQIDLLSESIENLHQESTADVWLFGTKDIGKKTSLNNFIKEFKSGNETYELPVDQISREQNETLANIVGPAYFVDVEMIICDDVNTCRNTNESGQLLSYDGHHLTQAGAQKLGQGLAEIFGQKTN